MSAPSRLSLRPSGRRSRRSAARLTDGPRPRGTRRLKTLWSGPRVGLEHLPAARREALGSHRQDRQFRCRNTPTMHKRVARPAAAAPPSVQNLGDGAARGINAQPVSFRERSDLRWWIGGMSLDVLDRRPKHLAEPLTSSDRVRRLAMVVYQHQTPWGGSASQPATFGMAPMTA
ncbi:hypothetical protein CC78DRAFT_567787 [Lojkania enalia]|uniref:Uncharacterized protein n=1 Tax=Lojkania enalia TaxID=147567 RepID=A0A9P4KAU8_9PLEO|nr:hypothetical protein CC78DRAFT_567787 [Didymosphaeria enalia]